MKAKEAELEKLKTKSSDLEYQLAQRDATNVTAAVHEQVNSIVQKELTKAMSSLKQSWDTQQRRQ